MQRQQFGIFVAACLSAIATSGCVPATYVEIPAIRGRVVNQDGRAVSNAIVHIARDSDRIEVATFSTQPDGSFARPRLEHFMVQFAGADRALCTYSVNASSGVQHSPTTQVSDGVRRWFFGYYDPPLDRDLGTLLLR